MWLRASLNLRRSRRWRWSDTWRRFSTAATLQRGVDEGDWCYASEWWDMDSSKAHTVFRSTSLKGNGVVSVLAFPSSRPSSVYWPETEKWLEQRHAELHPGRDRDERFRILGYQWRTLHFNDSTRQSTVKVMAAYPESEPASVCLMQQPLCLAVPYLRSMVSTGLATIASCSYDLASVTTGKKTMRVLCIGHGGGSLSMFLAKKMQGAIVDIVEIDPLVISASVGALGFPAFSVMSLSGQRALTKPKPIDEVLWKGIHERLYLYESDAEKFVLNASNVYDMIFIDAYDGDDIFPYKLWDPDFPFIQALNNLLHPGHGTAVVNLHSDDVYDSSQSASYFHEPLLPMGKHVSKVCRAYKESLVGKGNSASSGLGYTVSVPWVCNTTLVVCRGFAMNKRHCSGDLIMKSIISKSLEIESTLNLPFSCLHYIKRDFTVI
uniref:S-adenosyl-L-methionine-dependent methyltransferase superfamily protein n=1 Tax=Rhizophora mucronata TaxID=61149 RepID=A0A2P2NNZ6_RHIMU